MFFGNLCVGFDFNSGLLGGAGVTGKSANRVYFGIFDSLDIVNLGSALPGGAGVGG